jgi:hypothetical protein
MSPSVERRTGGQNGNTFIQTACNQLADGAGLRALVPNAIVGRINSHHPSMLGDATWVRLVGFSAPARQSTQYPPSGSIER